MPPVSYSDEKHLPTWYVVHVRCGRELVAASLIDHFLDLTVELLEVSQHRRGRLAKAALFPGYLLVAAPEGRSAVEEIDHTPGCGRLVRAGRMAGAAPGDPVRISGEQVALLSRRVESLNAAGGLPAHNLHPGQQVRILRGPLQGLDAVFVGPLTAAERVHVLLQFLGRQQEVQVDVGALEPATPIKRLRRTRGHGRYTTV